MTETSDRPIVKHATKSDIWLAEDFINEDVGPDVECERPLIHICGSCAHQFTAYQSGPWPDTENLKEVLCPSCREAGFRWDTIICTPTIADEYSSRQAQRYVRDRQHWDFWRGFVVSESSIKEPAAFVNSSETNMPAGFRKSALHPLSWTAFCPVCEQPDTGGSRFDFHHWDYDTDRGLQLCRDCHLHAHRGGTVQEQRVMDSVDDWRVDAASRLVEKMGREDLKHPWSVKRLNLPAEVEEEVGE